MSTLRARLSRYSLLYAFPTTLGGLGLLAACASTPEHPEWTPRVGVTTKAEVLQRYGPPDLVIASPDGDTALYRPPATTQAVPRVEVPTVQPGPFGTSTTRMQPIDPGPSAHELDRETKEPLRREVHIHYDARGVVQELSYP